jgi:hypothetical protein
MFTRREMSGSAPHSTTGSRSPNTSGEMKIAAPANLLTGRPAGTLHLIRQAVVIAVSWPQ